MYYLMMVYLSIAIVQHAIPRLSTSLATPKSDGLPVFLKFGDKLVSLLDNIVVLLVLVVWSVSLNHFVHPINRAWDAIGGNKIRQIPSNC
jgi:hypothetical protein